MIKLSEEQKRQAWEMYQDDQFATQIAKTLNVDYRRLQHFIYLMKNDLKKEVDIKNRQARNNGFKDYLEYQEHLVRLRGYQNVAEYNMQRIHRRGFENTSQYLDHLAKKEGYEDHLDYRHQRAVKRGFKDHQEYVSYLGGEKSKREPNRALSELINSKLKDFKKSQKWLAQILGVERQAVSLYSRGISIPKKDTLKLLLSTLQIHQIPSCLERLL